jgi:hypothetical protein
MANRLTRREAVAALAGAAGLGRAAAPPSFKLATFRADVTPPIGHPLLAGATSAPDAKRIDDPLFALGFVLTGGEQPVVLCSIDWCEIRNDAYDRWRAVLAEAAGTTRERVLVTSVHQHDVPLPDLEAQRILERHRAQGRIVDLDFHEKCVQRTARALKDSLLQARPVTHLGVGMGKVEKVASNRRYITSAGKVAFDRSSMSGGRPEQRDADVGLVDPLLRTLSFWNGDRPVCALHAFAVHPMSYWSTGWVTSDFPGLARQRRQADDPSIHQIYASGASGDVTTGKYNDGSHENRPILAERLYQGMLAAWKDTKKLPLTRLAFRVAPMLFTPRDTAGFTIEEMTAALRHPMPTKQALAALGLSARQRFDAKQPVDLPVLDFGSAVVVLLPGESYLHFQLLAQRLRPDAFVVALGYGECAAGYVAPDRAWDEDDSNLTPWSWVAPKTSEKVMTEALRKVLRG